MAPFFFSCDWGSTHFRLRLVDRRDGSLRDEIKTADGVIRMAEGADGADRAGRYAALLAAQAETLLARSGVEATQCVVSGMASSRLGWKELPYAPLPQLPDASGLVAAAFQVPLRGFPSLEVWLVSGVCGEANVLRGEEMEWLGLMHQLPALAEAQSALLILPGTHSKHLRLERGVLRDFDTLMTGELFASLPQAPTLRGCLLPGAAFEPESDGFLRGVRAAASPGLFKALFQIRARHLLQGVPPEEGTAALSGLLIGAELLQIPAEPGMRVVIAGGLGPFYQSAARELGLEGIEWVPGTVVEEALVWGHRRWLDCRAS